MSITLFPHNETAYCSASTMLSEIGKAAVIHPTGTGKSFIGFKLCEDHPDQRICWLSPSEYIYRTQLENLKKAAGGYEPENIQFYTYAKLMNMTTDELFQMQPDYIVMDEFHRAGAEQWQKGVEHLLKMFPEVPLLGLSATNIRYLDNQRDMADELFDGNVASEMTLGEAIVRGILNPPKYVLSVYSYQKDLKKYQQRIENAKNKAVRDAAEKYLEALRRALDKADGLEDIFDRHMTDRTGKYIVFCASYEHLCEMKAHTEWFEKVDKNPHIYTVYTEDPSASKSFQAFKEDNDISHLRLLYAIDALNEGIHLDDISGVILLRPTVSPIIYKQQIGRALAAGKSKEPVIFDIVNNIENLYSIDSVEREMQTAILYYRNDGLENEIVNEHFQVWDEVRDCRELFECLNNTLTASWDVMYAHAESYYKAYGHLDIPQRYKTADGYSLGSWITNQRRVYTGEVNGRMTPEQIEKLNGISMIWDRKSEITWKNGYAELLKYKEENGNLDIPSKYVTESGFALGNLTDNIRTAKSIGARSVFLTDGHEEILTELGFIWDKFDYAWEKYYFACAKYRMEHGSLDLSSDAVSADGLAIGAWVRRQRLVRAGKATGRLTENQIERLNELGFSWEDHFTQKWNDAWERLRIYKEENSHVNVPVNYVDKTGFALGRWVSRQRENKKLSEEKQRKLEELGWSKTVRKSGKVQEKRSEVVWMEQFEEAKRFYDTNGHLNVPMAYQTESGKKLCPWLNRQRKAKQTGKLSDEKVNLLESIGMVFEAEDPWEIGFSYAEEYSKTYGNLDVPVGYTGPDGYNLGIWIANQRNNHNNPTKYRDLTKEQCERLEKIGMIWNKREQQWHEGFRHASEYAELLPDGKWLTNYVSPDGYKTGEWLRGQKRQSMQNKLDADKAAMLAGIGFVFVE